MTAHRRLRVDEARPPQAQNLYARRDEQFAVIKAQYLKKGTVEKIAHRTDVSDVKASCTATPKENPRRNLAKRASSVGMGQ